jgi:endo-1,4-beta-xylanase
MSSKVCWGAHLEGAAVYDPPFVDALAKEKPKALVIGSGLKFGALHPLSIACEREHDGARFPTWTEVDDIATLAGRLRAELRGDALIWNDWLPDWIRALAARRPKHWREQLQAAFEQHLQDVFAHFDASQQAHPAASLRWCGVVNEPFEAWSLNDGNFPWRKGAWLDAFDATPGGSPGYIRRAFEIAEKFRGAAAPALFLNEANCENDRFGPKLRPALVALVAELKQAGCKVDAVGLQAHLMPQWMNDRHRPDWRPFRKFIDDLAALEVEIYITELDVLDCVANDIPARDQLVADYIYSFVSSALDQPATTMVTNWDFSDNYSWLRDNIASLGRWTQCGRPIDCPRPTLYDQALAPKPARDALARAFSGRRGQ